MLGIYLSWSVYQLVMFLVVFGLISFIPRYVYYDKTLETFGIFPKDKRLIKKPLIIMLIFYILIFLSAFDVGTKQEYIDRARFNTAPSGIVTEKVQNDAVDAEQVLEQYRSKLNETKKEEVE
tara:strand:+ start:77297 stop:77662 length:366 start_codon:yes stop_codon:yes gene_type:complete